MVLELTRSNDSARDFIVALYGGDSLSDGELQELADFISEKRKERKK